MTSKQEALEKLELLRLRASSHAAISNCQKTMQDWIDRDAEFIRAALTEAPKVNVKSIIQTWVSVWNQRLNPPLSFNDLDKFEAFAEWLTTHYDLVKKSEG